MFKKQVPHYCKGFLNRDKEIFLTFTVFISTVNMVIKP